MKKTRNISHKDTEKTVHDIFKEQTMKKFLTMAAILTLALAACDQPTDDGNTKKLPTLTIRNESSFDLTNVKFSGISFSTSGSGDLLRSTQSVQKLTANDLNKAGYITFTRKDIGITCRTEAISVTDQNLTFTFLDTTIVEEVANTSNRKALGQISFLSQVTIEYSGRNVARNDIVNLGETSIGRIKQFDFTLKNASSGKLILDGNEPVKITNTSAADVFSVVQPASSEIAVNGSLPYKINVNPKDEQLYTATVTVSSNDRDGDFSFTISTNGVPSKPIAGIMYSGNEIPQNGEIIAGEVIITLSKTITITITNSGEVPLTVDPAGITISGTDAAAFTRTTTPGISIQPGNQTTFNIECRPAREGENSAVLTIPTNDNSRNPVIINLKITGVKGNPVLELSQGSTVIENNSLTPFDFGQVEVASSQTFTFTVKNSGNIVLELTGTPAVESSNAVFAVLSQPGTTVNPGSTVTFNVRYSPTDEKTDTGYITILNNSNTGVFTLNIRGTGFIKKPQITIKQGDVTINQNGEFNFGSAAINENKEITFTIGNSGDADLTFITENSNRVNLSDNTDNLFTVIQQPLASAAVAP